MAFFLFPYHEKSFMPSYQISCVYRFANNSFILIIGMLTKSHISAPLIIFYADKLTQQYLVLL